MSLPKATGSPANMACLASRTRALSEMMWRQRRKAWSDISDLCGFELVEGGVAEIADAELADEDGLAFFGLAAAHAIFAGGDGVLDHGVADDDLGVGEGAFIHGEMFVGEGAGVEEEGVAGFGGGDDELVHDAAGGVDVVVLGAAGEDGDVFDGEGGAGEGEHGHGAGDFDGGGGAEACAEGDVAGEMQVEGGRLDAALLQLTEDADGIVGPDAAGGGAVVAIEGEGFGEELAGEAVDDCRRGGRWWRGCRRGWPWGGRGRRCSRYARRGG